MTWVGALSLGVTFAVVMLGACLEDMCFPGKIVPNLPDRCLLENYMYTYGVKNVSGCSLYCEDLGEFPVINASWGLLRIKMANSWIVNLTEETFANASGLRIISMHYCAIYHVAPGTFSQLSKLRYLSLSWNPMPIATLENVICSLPNHTHVAVFLKGLYLRYMPEPFPQEALRCLRNSSMRKFDFSDNAVNISNLNQIMCHGNRALKNFSFEAVTLHTPISLDQGLFWCDGSADMTYTGIRNIKNLNLAQNGLSNLSNTSFANLSRLVSLDLSGCDLQMQLSSMNQLEGSLDNLQSLYLKQNNFRDFRFLLTQPMDQPFSKLLHLDLSGNRFWWLAYFPNNSAFPNLQQLVINSNSQPLGNIPDNLIANLTKLKTLKLNGNMFDRMHWMALHSNSLKHLELKSISMRLKGSSYNLFSYCPGLQSLLLDNLNIGKWDTPGYRVALERFLSRAFRNLTSLKLLSLKSVGIVYIDPKMFENTANIQELYLSYNHITHIGKDAFLALCQLKDLHLDNNDISNINKTIFPKTGHDLQVKINFNPWFCDCALYYFRYDLMMNNTDHIVLDRGKVNYTCSLPPYRNGMKVVDYQPSWKHCFFNGLPGTYFVMVYVSSGHILLALIASVVFRFRWHIYYVYINSRAATRQNRELKDVSQYEYDAFIAYNRDDMRWVVHTLVPELEKERGLRVCLHDRDWLAGVDIVENIQQSIEKSRKVALVITNAFACSNWCQLELTMAQHRLFAQDRDNLILILKEPIADCYMTPRLALQMRTQTYIEWNETQMGQRVFWARLARAIKGPTRSVRNRPVNLSGI